LRGQPVEVALGVTAERIYVDHGLTGTNRGRPGLRQALAACREGDTLVVTKLDRLARSLPDARDIVDDLTRQILGLRRDYPRALAARPVTAALGVANGPTARAGLYSMVNDRPARVRRRTACPCTPSWTCFTTTSARWRA
jgi:hypothetical protein